MRRFAYALTAVLLGFACGYGFTRPAAVPDEAVAAGTVTSSAAPPEAPVASTRAPRLPRATSGDANTVAGIPALQRSAALTPPPRPLDAPSWSSELDALRQRAEAGDGAAASEWLRRDGRCYAMLSLQPESGATLPTQSFMRAVVRRGRLSAYDDQVAAAVQIADAEQRRVRLGLEQQRLVEECRGYVPQPPSLRYALGEIAARLGSDKDFWRFIAEPPLAPGYSRDIEQAVDWARRAPGLVYQRAAAGDAEAAYALGLAYAVDGPRDIEEDMNPSALLAAAVGNDAFEAYRWLSVYLRANPDGGYAEAARALITRLAAELTPEQRASAAEWRP